MRIAFKVDHGRVFCSDREILIYEISGMAIFSKTPQQRSLIADRFNELFHSLSDLHMQICIETSLLRLKDLQGHFDGLAINNEAVNRYIMELKDIIDHNSIPHKRYYLVFSNILEVNRKNIIGILSRLNFIGFSFRKIEPDQYLRLLRRFLGNEFD